MKKKITLSLLLALCLVLSLGGAALASGEMAVPYVTDAAGLLTQDEEFESIRLRAVEICCHSYHPFSVTFSRLY